MPNEEGPYPVSSSSSARRLTPLVDFAFPSRMICGSLRTMQINVALMFSVFNNVQVSTASMSEDGSIFELRNSSQVVDSCVTADSNFSGRRKWVSLSKLLIRFLFFLTLPSALGGLATYQLTFTGISNMFSHLPLITEPADLVLTLCTAPQFPWKTRVADQIKERGFWCFMPMRCAASMPHRSKLR